MASCTAKSRPPSCTGKCGCVCYFVFLIVEKQGRPPVRTSYGHPPVQIRCCIPALVPRHTCESWGRSQGISRQELLRRVSTVSMVSCAKKSCIIASPCCYCRAVPLFCMPLFLDLHSIPGHRTGGARVRIPSLSGKFTSLKFPLQWLCHRPAVPLFLLCHFCMPLLFVTFFNESTIRNSKK